METDSPREGVEGPAGMRTFGEAVLGLYPRLLSYARRLAASAADAEDLVHDAIERGLVRRHLFRDGRLEGWMSAILRHIFLDRCRRRQTWRTIGVELAHLMAVGPGGDGPLDEVAILDLRARSAGARCFGTDDVRRAMAHLSPKMKEVFFLFVFERLSQREISHRLGLPVSTVGTRLLRARRQLRLVLEAGPPRTRDRAHTTGKQRPMHGRRTVNRSGGVTPGARARASR